MAKISKNPPVNMNIPGMDSGGGDDPEGVFFPGETITHTPNLDVYSSPVEVVVEVEMPGVRKEDIEVTLLEDILTIKALKYECFDEDKVNYVCMERAFGRILRKVEIPFPVDTSRMKAVYKRGVLTVRIPRIEEKRGSAKKVPIE